MTWSRRSPWSRSHGDRLLTAVAAAAGLATAAVVALIAFFVLAEAWPALTRLGPGRFLTDPSWHPRAGHYGLTPMIAATAASSLAALTVAAPVGLATAIFRRHYASPAIGRWLGRLVELAAGIPSVVYGLWGLTVLVPWIVRLRPPGTCLLAAVVVLALMLVPTVALTADAALARVPASQLRAAAALGLSRATTVFRIALPAARGGIGAGLMLAAGRALGETMAVMMVAGNVVAMPGSPFAPIRTLTANIALEMSYATAEHRAVLFVSGAALLAVVALGAIAAEWLGRRTEVAG